MPDQRRDDARTAVAGAAVGGGAVAALRPTRAPELSAEGEKARKKLAGSRRSTVKLSPKEYAAIAGGRGGRFQQRAYTAQLARAVEQGKVRPKGPTVRVYRDSVVQLDGAHRAHAAVMRRKPVKVKVASRSKRNEPSMPALARASREWDKRRQQRRLSRDRYMTREQMNAAADRYSPWAAKLNAVKSRAEHWPAAVLRAVGLAKAEEPGMSLVAVAKDYDQFQQWMRSFQDDPSWSGNERKKRRAAHTAAYPGDKADMRRPPAGGGGGGRRKADKPKPPPAEPPDTRGLAGKPSRLRQQALKLTGKRAGPAVRVGSSLLAGVVPGVVAGLKVADPKKAALAGAAGSQGLYTALSYGTQRSASRAAREAARRSGAPRAMKGDGTPHTGPYTDAAAQHRVWSKHRKDTPGKRGGGASKRDKMAHTQASYRSTPEELPGAVRRRVGAALYGPGTVGRNAVPVSVGGAIGGGVTARVRQRAANKAAERAAAAQRVKRARRNRVIAAVGSGSAGYGGVAALNSREM